MTTNSFPESGRESSPLMWFNPGEGAVSKRFSPLEWARRSLNGIAEGTDSDLQYT